MIVSFQNKLAKNLMHGISSKETRRFPKELHRNAIRKLTQLDLVTQLETLWVPPSNNFESLQGDRVGSYSIRINDVWRVCFTWTEDGPAHVEIVNYHD